jgi:hypothetical protein
LNTEQLKKQLAAVPGVSLFLNKIFKKIADRLLKKAKETTLTTGYMDLQHYDCLCWAANDYYK